MSTNNVPSGAQATPSLDAALPELRRTPAAAAVRFKIQAKSGDRGQVVPLSTLGSSSEQGAIKSGPSYGYGLVDVKLIAPTGEAAAESLSLRSPRRSLQLGGSQRAGRTRPAARLIARRNETQLLDRAA
ncbi:MAG TPA: hypothetical protein VNT32_13070 [Thermoleophilaceae bacterium]|nr:hypothetical protein [Thermoleophilaceae bacterium]